MHNLHSYCCRTSLRYHRWHKYSYHAHHHWGVLLFVIIIVAFVLHGGVRLINQEADDVVGLVIRAHAQTSPEYQKLVDLADAAMVRWQNTENNINTPNRYYPYQFWDWDVGVLMVGVWRAYETTGDTRYRDFIKNYLDGFIQSDGSFNFKNGHATDPNELLNFYLVAEMAEESISDAQKFYTAAIREADFVVNNWTRNQNDTRVFDQSAQGNQRGEMWADSIFMDAYPLAKIGQLSGNSAYLDAAIDQIVGHTREKNGGNFLQNRNNGLLVHWWDFDNNGDALGSPGFSSNPSSEFWGRGNGWLAAATVDTLEILPANHSRRGELQDILSALLGGLSTVQAPSGRWYTVLDYQTTGKGPSNGNFEETSGSSLITYGYIKAKKNGYVSANYDALTQKAKQGLNEKIFVNGSMIVDGVSIGTGPGTYEYYVGRYGTSNILWGDGAALMALSTMVGSSGPPPKAQCEDGQDNDGDRLTDHPTDPGCSTASDTDEYNALPVDSALPTLTPPADGVFTMNFSHPLWKIAPGDFDSDGDLDFAAKSFWDPITQSVWIEAVRNDGDGSSHRLWQHDTKHDESSDPTGSVVDEISLLSWDFNGDGYWEVYYTYRTGPWNTGSPRHRIVNGETGATLVDAPYPWDYPLIDGQVNGPNMAAVAYVAGQPKIVSAWDTPVGHVWMFDTYKNGQWSLNVTWEQKTDDRKLHDTIRTGDADQNGSDDEIFAGRVVYNANGSTRYSLNCGATDQSLLGYFTGTSELIYVTGTNAKHGGGGCGLISAVHASDGTSIWSGGDFNLVSIFSSWNHWHNGWLDDRDASVPGWELLADDSRDHWAFFHVANIDNPLQSSGSLTLGQPPLCESLQWDGEIYSCAGDRGLGAGDLGGSGCEEAWGGAESNTLTITFNTNCSSSILSKWANRHYRQDIATFGSGYASFWFHPLDISQPPTGGNPYCGDGTCNGSETITSCPVDCNSGSVVGVGGSNLPPFKPTLTLVSGGGGGAVCGNNTIESGEVCDGSNLNNKTCITQGFAGGTLTCGTSCTFNTTACANPPPTGTVFYVDPAGNDSNNGTSQATPWKTIAKVNATQFQPGSQILFKRGGEWRDRVTASSSGTSGNPIVFGAYGTGIKPIINGSFIQTGWTNISGNIWKATISQVLDPVEPDLYMVSMNKTRATKMNVQSELAQEFQYWHNSVANEVYIYSPSNPNTRYTSPGVEVSIKFGNIYLNQKNYITIQNLHLTNSNSRAINLHDGVSPNTMPSDNIIVEDVTADLCGRTFISGEGGSENWEVRRNVVTHCGENSDSDGIYIHDGSNYWNIYENRFSYSGGDDVAIVGGTGHRIYRNVFGPSNAGEISTGVTVLDAGNDVHIYDNEIYGHDVYGIVVKGSNVKIYRNNIHENGWDTANGNQGGILTNGSNADIGLEIHNNLIWGHENNGGIDLWNGGDNAKMYNNTIYGNKYGIGLHKNGTNTKDNVDLKNNIVMNNNAGIDNAGKGIDVQDAVSPIFANNNVIGNLNGNYSGTMDRTGQNGNISVDPKFVNAASGDFHLQPTSPMINAGASLSSPYNVDFEGTQRPQGSGWDIGGDELGTAPPPVDTIPPSFSSSGGFTVSPLTTTGSSTLSWNVTDNTALDRVEIMRASYIGIPAVLGTSTQRSWWKRLWDIIVSPLGAAVTGATCDETSKTGCQWTTIQLVVAPNQNQTSWQGSWTDTTLTVGKWWYGIHAIDKAGNRKTEPTPPGPVLVERLQGGTASPGCTGDCSAGTYAANTRYIHEVFSSVTTTKNVPYSQSLDENGQMQTHLMDTYEPSGDIATNRPLIIFMHGGGFMEEGSEGNTKDNMTELPIAFAKRGYVTASINYRTRPGGVFGASGGPLGTTALQMRLEAQYDAEAAVRWFRCSAIATNPSASCFGVPTGTVKNKYKIDPTKIAMGGASAGGGTSMMVGFNADNDFQNPRVNDNMSNTGYFSTVSSVIDISGQPNEQTFELGESPIILFHSLNDPTVPYVLAQNAASVLQSKGMTYEFHTFSGSNHAQALYNANTSFMNTEIADFLYRNVVSIVPL